MLSVAMVLGEGEQAAGPWRVVTVAELVGMVGPGERAPEGRPWILAVDGRSGSGKTTLASRLVAAVPASAVVHTDDVAWSQAMFDWAGLLAGGILEPVRRGEPVSFRPPAWRERGREGVNRGSARAQAADCRGRRGSTTGTHVSRGRGGMGAVRRG